MIVNNEKKSKKREVRALLLMSGGLDSLLAAKILAVQEIDVTLLCFKSYFFDCSEASKAAKQIGFNLRVVDFSKKQLEIVKNPRHGRGKAINPCIDCHLLMLIWAKEIMEREDFDFIATGEVLEERPMSQNKRALELIEREAGLEGKLLRPLSAKLLDETEAEKKGIVERAKLEAISGRSRSRQLELAVHFGIKKIPQPSGGCILTEKNYTEKLEKLLENKKDINESDVKLLSSGRVFWEGEVLVVVARNEGECQNLEKLAKPGDFQFFPQNFSGPTVLIRNFGTKDDKKNLKEAGKSYVFKYSKKIPPEAKILVIHNENL